MSTWKGFVTSSPNREITLGNYMVCRERKMQEPVTFESFQRQNWCYRIQHCCLFSFCFNGKYFLKCTKFCLRIWRSVLWSHPSPFLIDTGWGFVLSPSKMPFHFKEWALFLVLLLTTSSVTLDQSLILSLASSSLRCAMASAAQHNIKVADKDYM